MDGWTERQIIALENVSKIIIQTLLNKISWITPFMDRKS